MPDVAHWDRQVKLWTVFVRIWTVIVFTIAAGSIVWLTVFWLS